MKVLETHERKLLKTGFVAKVVYRYRQDASEVHPKRGNIRECTRAAKILPDLRLYERTVCMVITDQNHTDLIRAKQT